MIDSRLRNVIIGVVTAVWALNFLAGLAIPSYEPDQAINAVFMGTVGVLFAVGARNHNSGNDGNSDNRKDSGDKPPPPPPRDLEDETPRPRVRSHDDGGGGGSW